MTLKNTKLLTKSDIFCRKILRKYFNLFSKIFRNLKIFRFWSKKAWFYKILEKMKKKIKKGKKEKQICQNGKFGSVALLNRLGCVCVGCVGGVWVCGCVCVCVCVVFLEGLHNTVCIYTHMILQHGFLLVQRSMEKDNKILLNFWFTSMEGFEILTKCVCWYYIHT